MRRAITKADEEEVRARVLRIMGGDMGPSMTWNGDRLTVLGGWAYDEVPPDLRARYASAGICPGPGGWMVEADAPEKVSEDPGAIPGSNARVPQWAGSEDFGGSDFPDPAFPADGGMERAPETKARSLKEVARVVAQAIVGKTVGLTVDAVAAGLLELVTAADARQTERAPWCEAAIVHAQKRDQAEEALEGADDANVDLAQRNAQLAEERDEWRARALEGAERKMRGARHALEFEVPQ